MARAEPSPSIRASSECDAFITSNGVPKRSSNLAASFGPTPGRLARTDICCDETSEDFFIFFMNGPCGRFSLLAHSESKSFAVCAALGVGIMGILNSIATAASAP